MYDQTSTTRVPAGETDYLAKAAEQLDKIERSLTSHDAARRLQVVDGYTVLGAIQRGQLPAALARDLFDRLAAGHPLTAERPA